MTRIVKALVAGLLAWLVFAAVGVVVFLLFPLWPWSAILGVLMFLGAPLPATLVALIVLLGDDKKSEPLKEPKRDE